MFLEMLFALSVRVAYEMSDLEEFLAIFVDFYSMPILYASTEANEVSRKSFVSWTNDRSDQNSAHTQKATVRNT